MKTRVWKERPNHPAIEAGHISLQRNPLLARLLANRKISTGETGLFSSPKMDYVNWDQALGGINDAAHLLLNVVKKKGRVAVIGDYDVDGTSSAAMIQWLCRQLGVDCHVFLPSRHEHGYGLNAKTVPAFIKSVGKPPDLLIAADCGTSSEPEIDELRKFGAKRIAIIDHHIADQKRFSQSADIVVNWRLGTSEEMCAAGQIFVMAKVLEKMLDRKLTTDILLLAAIATVADMSPVNGLNRIIVKNGLARASKTKLPGLKQLLSFCDVDGYGLSQNDVSFTIAPLINAVGRMDRPNLAYELMIEEDEAKAMSMAAQLREYNQNRKIAQFEIAEQASELADKLLQKGIGSNGLLLIKPEWNHGIVGVVASRIVEKYFVPSIVMGEFQGNTKGSGRSMEGVHLKEIMDSCADQLFAVYGGHEMAAGATLKAGMEKQAAKIWDDACGAYFKTHPRPEPVLYYDLELPPEYVTVGNCQVLREIIHPYDRRQNPEPVFLMRGVDVVKLKRTDGGHYQMVRFSGRKDGRELPLQFKSFRSDHQDVLEGQAVDILFTMSQSWNERFGPCLWIQAMRPTSGEDWAEKSDESSMFDHAPKGV